MNTSCRYCASSGYPVTHEQTCGKCSVIGHGVSSRFEARGSVVEPTINTRATETSRTLSNETRAAMIGRLRGELVTSQTQRELVLDELAVAAHEIETLKAHYTKKQRDLRRVHKIVAHGTPAEVRRLRRERGDAIRERNEERGRANRAEARLQKSYDLRVGDEIRHSKFNLDSIQELAELIGLPKLDKGSCYGGAAIRNGIKKLRDTISTSQLRSDTTQKRYEDERERANKFSAAEDEQYTRAEEAIKERDVLQRAVDAAYEADCERDTDGGVVEGEAAVILRDHVSNAVYGPINEPPPVKVPAVPVPVQPVVTAATPAEFKPGIRCEVVGDGYCQIGSEDRIGKIVTLDGKAKRGMGSLFRLCPNTDVTCWNVIDFDGGENCFSEAGLKPIPTCGECYWWRPLDARGYVRPYFGQKPQPGKCIDENGKRLYGIPAGFDSCKRFSVEEPSGTILSGMLSAINFKAK